MMYRHAQMEEKIKKYYAVRKEYAETPASLAKLGRKFGCSYQMIAEMLSGRHSEVKYIAALNDPDIRETVVRKLIPNCG